MAHAVVDPMTKPATRLLAGATAGLAATATMTGALALAKAAGLLGEPPPHKLTRKILAVVGPRPKRGGLAHHVATLAAHVGYGVAMGMIYGLLPRRVSRVPAGAAFGLAVWAGSYMGWIPKLGLMPPPSRDRPGRPTAMILAHLVYGATLGGARRRLGV